MANAPAALGASAAVNAIVLLDILLYPKRMVYLYMVLPIPAALLGVVYIVGDMSGLLGVRHCSYLSFQGGACGSLNTCEHTLL